ncbi:MAG: hypothetical protein KKB30_02730 [Proteobacteria bacterium]|nr:hypothetical protein [Pseudomonadota bacterium]MBU1716743.1 hypothetical protein [Pseudomonadota bacterium]
MKLFPMLAIMILLISGNASADEVYATASEVDGNTVISCTPREGGDIERAYITLYESDGLNLSIIRQEMNVSYSNETTYVLTGKHNIIKGMCKFILADGSKRITRGEFSVSMR